MFDDLVHCDGKFGNDDHVRAAREAAHRRDPASGSTHCLDDDDAVMRDGGRVETIERFGDDADGCIEANAVLRAGEIVVERLWHAHDRGTALSQPIRDSLGAVAADRDKSVKILVDSGEYEVAAALRLVEAVASSPEQRAALANDASKVARGKRGTFKITDETGPTVRDANNLVSVSQRHLADCANSGVQTGRVASGSENTDSHDFSFTRPRTSLRLCPQWSRCAMVRW